MRSVLLLMITVFSATNVHADVTVYTNKPNWLSAAPEFSTITFTELPVNTWITDQYGYLGVYFTDGSDLVHQSSNFVTDFAGLNGALDETTLHFDTPMTTIAIEFPGQARIRLFANRELIYTSPLFGITPTGNFGGLISTIPFDTVVLDDPIGGLFVDNLYFGPPIPAPGALALLGIAVCCCSNRRRRNP